MLNRILGDPLFLHEECLPDLAGTEFNIAVQQGVKSFGDDQGRFMIDPERSNESEHAVHHFNMLV